MMVFAAVAAVLFLSLQGLSIHGKISKEPGKNGAYPFLWTENGCDCAIFRDDYLCENGACFLAIKYDEVDK